jgi:hypothetical protein
VVEGAVDDVEGSVPAVLVGDSVDVVDSGRVGAAVVGAVDDVEGSVLAAVVVAGSVDDVGDGVVGVVVEAVGTEVVVGSVGGVPLCSASWATIRRTAAPCAEAWLGVVVVVNSVEGGLAVEALLLEAAFAISSPAATSTPPMTAGISTWAQRGSCRYRWPSPGLSVPPAVSPCCGGSGSVGGLASLMSMLSDTGGDERRNVRAESGRTSPRAAERGD